MQKCDFFPKRRNSFWFIFALLKSEEIVIGDVPIIEYSYGNKSYEKQKAYFDHIEGVVLTVELSWAHKASSSNTSSTPSVSSSNTDLDKLLDEYEKCVNECVNLINRQDRGENVPESQIDKLLGKIEELEKNWMIKQIKCRMRSMSVTRSWMTRFGMPYRDYIKLRTDSLKRYRQYGGVAFFY